MSRSGVDALRPADLPIDRPPPTRRMLRVLALLAVHAVALYVLSLLLDSLEVTTLRASLAMIVVLGLLNAVVWPVIVRITLPLVLITVGLFTLVLNVVFVSVAAAIVPGVEVESWWTALVVALVATVVNLSIGTLVHIDGDFVWRSKVARRVVQRVEPPERTDVPGVLFVQIDGLGHEVITEAIRTGQTPFLSRLVESGTHRVIAWECDLSSQTGAMQAGILLGDNHNMPAFRWYEKETGRVMVTNRPKDAAELESRQSSGAGLLVGGGASRANVFTGDATDTMFTFSSVGNRSGSRDRFLYVVAAPSALLRIVALSVADIVREKRSYRRARRDGVELLGHRGGVYPLLRAATTVVLAEITWSVLVADIARGVPSAYVDLVGYDEVAHHSGPGSADALDQLRRIDNQLERVLTTLVDAPRPYHVVVLADHGQTQGATFEQRYGQTLDDLVNSLAAAPVAAPVLAEEGWNNVNGLLTSAAEEPSTLGRIVARATRNRTTDGEVVIGPETARQVAPADDQVIVLASGNLGLVSFTDLPGRATRQRIDDAHPGLVDGLRRHPGIGFVLVRDEDLGDVVLGPNGVHHLDDGRIDGDDPLSPFGPNAAEHLRRTSGFDNCPDLLVNSFYDPTADEGAAFEPLIGFHGGLGGGQSRPFVLAPATLTQPTAPLVGARSIHELFTTWLDEIQGVDRGGGRRS
jgi:uncharacterized membrane protein YvlD (DUF360 family)